MKKKLHIRPLILFSLCAVLYSFGQETVPFQIRNSLSGVKGDLYTASVNVPSIDPIFNIDAFDALCEGDFGGCR